MYDDLIALRKAGGVLEKFQMLSEGQLDQLNSIKDTIPESYRNFLLIVGYGSLIDCSYMIYSGPTSIGDIFGNRISHNSELRVFGDDYQGYIAGFRQNDERVFEVDPNTQEQYVISPNFREFIYDRIK